jgi:hypothetical protein
MRLFSIAQGKAPGMMQEAFVFYGNFLALGSGAARRGGSSPFTRTTLILVKKMGFAR